MNSKDFILLIPCFNNASGLSSSIRSIQYPTNKYEIVIVDDGSSIPLSIDNLKELHPGITIELIRINPNKGIVNALNTGLRALSTRTDYKYIARLDAGDICYPERFTQQVQFLDSHVDIFLLGTWCRFVNDETGKGYDYITKTKHEEIIKEMHYKCSFIHPTVMFRKEVLDTVGYYPTDYPHAEDYAYFWQIMKSFKGEILPLELLQIDFSDENVSTKNYKKQLISRMRIVNHFGDRRYSKLLGLALLGCRYLLPRKIMLMIKT